VTLRASLHEFLRDEINVSVYDARLPIRPMMPALVQTFVGGGTVQTHSNRRSLIARRVQIDAFANNDEEVDRMATHLLHALDGYHGPMNDVDIGWATLLSDFDTNPTEIKTGDRRSGAVPEVRYRRILDFEVAYQEVSQESS
jgi:hypothetical protein